MCLDPKGVNLFQGRICKLYKATNIGGISTRIYETSYIIFPLTLVSSAKAECKTVQRLAGDVSSLEMVYTPQRVRNSK